MAYLEDSTYIYFDILEIMKPVSRVYHHGTAKGQAIDKPFLFPVYH